MSTAPSTIDHILKRGRIDAGWRAVGPAGLDDPIRADSMVVAICVNDICTSQKPNDPYRRSSTLRSGKVGATPQDQLCCVLDRRWMLMLPGESQKYLGGCRRPDRPPRSPRSPRSPEDTVRPCMYVCMYVFQTQNEKRHSLASAIVSMKREAWARATTSTLRSYQNMVHRI